MLHPFYNYQVIFSREAGQTGQILTGLAGPALDLLFALVLSSVVWRWKRPLAFPILVWGSLALFGEGLGMISSLASFASQGGSRWYEDVTQLFRICMPAWPLWTLSVLLTIAGVLMMSLIAPLSGIPPADSLPRRVTAYVVFLPLYFLVAILWILVFSPRLDGLGMRLGQLSIALPVAVILALVHGRVQVLARRIRVAMPVMVPGRRDLAVLAAATLVAFGGLLLAG